MNLQSDLRIAIDISLEDAKHRRHEYAGIEHLLLAMLNGPEVQNCLEGCGANVEQLRDLLEGYLGSELERLPDGPARPASPTLGFQRVIQRAALHCHSAGKEEVLDLNVLVAMFAEPDCDAVAFLNELGVTRFDIIAWISHGVTKENEPQFDPDDEDEDEGGPMGPGGRRQQRDPLDAFCIDLNAEAREGNIDPLIGRDREVERIIHVLARRRKNNPILVGDSGVGKTALVEGLARHIVEGNVPEILSDATIYSLDMGSLLAGTRFRGDFEKRMKAVVKRLESMEGAVLFIDEIHTLIGAGSASGGTMDAANLLKPGLASGRIRCIGSTTYEEFRTVFQRDRALARRFQKVELGEPTISETIAILEGLRPRYEAFHEVTYTRPALRAAAELSQQYLRERRLPDKAIDLIDEAGAAARVSGNRRRVGAPQIEATIATMAQIPKKRATRSERDRLSQLQEDLRSVVFGQDPAIEQVVSAVKLARAGLREPEKPMGSFLFTGPTGVGKTEVAKQLAETLNLHLIRFDMSEYMERHTVSRLIGAPPGYVGFDQGGLLTEQVTKNPHAVLLLDEIEKAHPDVFNLLLQVMDHGTLTDNNGRVADFRHVVLIMTSNIGARDIERTPVGFGDANAAGDGDKAYTNAFSPEFRNRLDARVQFAPLGEEVMLRIVDKFIHELCDQLRPQKVTILVQPAAREWLAEEGFDPLHGARPLSRVIQEHIKRPLADELLFGSLSGGGEVTVDRSDDGLTFTYTSR